MRTAYKRTDQALTEGKRGRDLAFRIRDGRLVLAEQDRPLDVVWSWPEVDPATLALTSCTGPPHGRCVSTT